MGAIAAAAQPEPIGAPNQRSAFTDDSGLLTNIGMSHLKTGNAILTGTSRIIPCGCTGTNVLAWTPNPGGPLIKGYFDYEVFSFVAEATSTGAVTATVVPATGALATLKVYKTNGSAQAGNNDLTIGLHYTATYVDTLDSGAGGFVLR